MIDVAGTRADNKMAGCPANMPASYDDTTLVFLCDFSFIILGLFAIISSLFKKVTYESKMVAR